MKDDWFVWALLFYVCWHLHSDIQSIQKHLGIVDAKGNWTERHGENKKPPSD